MEETRFDPRRRLCPDGSCIGVIGPDGLCKVCGRPSSGIAAVPMTNVDAEAGGDADSGGDADAIGDPDDHAHAHADAHADAGTGDFDPQRRLCDDGSCVGVIGPDGTCRVCGRRAEG